MANLHIGQLVDVAYEIAKNEFVENAFSFSSIWSKTWKSAENFKKETVEDWIGNFYLELLLDPRFVCFSNNNWRLKDFMDYSEIKKLEKHIVVDEALYDEDYQTTSSSSEKPKASKEKLAAPKTEEDEELESLIDSEF